MNEILLKQENSIQNELTKEPKIYQRARAQFNGIYENSNDSTVATDEIADRLEPFFEVIDKNLLSNEEIAKIKNNLRACSAITDKDEFINAVMDALKPALDVRVDRAAEFEEAQAHAMNITGGFTKINRLLSYGKSGPTIHIHAPPGETVGNKITLYREALRKLAKIVDADPEIQKITATSVLVATHPGIFTRAGFEVENISDKFKQQHFAGEKEELKNAKISREEFLKRFLVKDL